MSTLDDRTAAWLATPSLAGLSYRLTHPEVWPRRFEFDFGYSPCCGMGLAFRAWGVGRRPDAMSDWLDWVARLFNITTGDAMSLFVYVPHPVTPRSLAAHIDAYLAAHP